MDMTDRNISDIAEDFAVYVDDVAPCIGENGGLRYYLAGSIGTMLTCNAVIIETNYMGNDAATAEKISVSPEDRQFLQKYFPRQTTDIDVISVNKDDNIKNFAVNTTATVSTHIKAAIPDVGKLCKMFAGNTIFSSDVWDNLQEFHDITHKVARITTERGNTLYVSSPDYQLAHKMWETLIYMNMEKKNPENISKDIRDSSIMFSAFSNMYTDKELMQALTECKRLDRKSCVNETAASCLKKVAPHMIDYLEKNIPSSEDTVKTLQKMLNQADRAIVASYRSGLGR